MAHGTADPKPKIKKTPTKKRAVKKSPVKKKKY